jgi:hypothetical protein
VNCKAVLTFLAGTAADPNTKRSVAFYVALALLGADGWRRGFDIPHIVGLLAMAGLVVLDGAALKPMLAGAPPDLPPPAPPS